MKVIRHLKQYIKKERKEKKTARHLLQNTKMHDFVHSHDDLLMIYNLGQNIMEGKLYDQSVFIIWKLFQQPHHKEPTYCYMFNTEKADCE